MKLNQVAAYYRKRSQLIVLTGILLGGGYQSFAVNGKCGGGLGSGHKKIAAGEALTDEEQTWFIDTFSKFRYDSNVNAMVLIPVGTNGEDDLVLGGNDNYRYSKTKNSVVIGG